jgi:hypothetical protein
MGREGGGRGWEGVDHFGYLWPQKMPEVGNLWLQKKVISWQFMATETAGYWRFMALSYFLIIFMIPLF